MYTFLHETWAFYLKDVGISSNTNSNEKSHKAVIEWKEDFRLNANNN